MKSRVFVIQNQHRWNAGVEKFEPKFDLSPAEEFGELVYLLSPTASPFNPDPLIKELRNKLYDFGPDDYLLLIGNPVLIGLSVSIASLCCDSVSLLQWSGKDRRYIKISVDSI